jgi:hypothetical protein
MPKIPTTSGATPDDIHGAVIRHKRDGRRPGRGAVNASDRYFRAEVSYWKGTPA